MLSFLERQWQYLDFGILCFSLNWFFFFFSPTYFSSQKSYFKITDVIAQRWDGKETKEDLYKDWGQEWLDSLYRNDLVTNKNKIGSFWGLICCRKQLRSVAVTTWRWKLQPFERGLVSSENIYSFVGVEPKPSGAAVPPVLPHWGAGVFQGETTLLQSCFFDFPPILSNDSCISHFLRL